MHERNNLNILRIFNRRIGPVIVKDSQSQIEIYCCLADVLIATEMVLVHFELVICIISLNQGYHFAHAVAC